MNHWKVIPTIVLATVLIFGAGVFSGGFLVNFVKEPRPRAAKRPAPVQTNSVSATNPAGASVKLPKPPEILSKEFLQRLDANLQLTPEQHEAVQKIITEGQNFARKAVQDARLEIREVLTPEQRKRFDALIKRPFHKPVFDTNAVSPARLQSLEKPAGEPLSPEAQGLLLERERVRMTNLASPLPPPNNAP